MIPELTDKYYKEKFTVLNALHQVNDPELNINIVDLGLVYAVEVTDRDINVDMTLSTRSCPMGGMITAHAKLAVEEAMPGYTVVINLVWEPKWNADKISEEGKALLGW
ncbi:MAG TPA: metal-sulfur cluster assembly factor [Flavipsychrobacter sp.]|nr:metal-sulfur cluster assembly factor [Flavipsychrobacter sp.]